MTSSKSVRFAEREVPREGENLMQVIYFSTMVHATDLDDIKDVLATSQRNNTRSDVTGLLLYHQGNVLQFLEGEESAVIDVYTRIARDSRHRGVLPIAKRPIKRRDFGNWRMGFKEMSEVDRKDLDGYCDLVGAVTANPAAQSDMSPMVQRLIQSYQKLYHDDDMTPIERPIAA